MLTDAIDATTPGTVKITVPDSTVIENNVGELYFFLEKDSAPYRGEDFAQL